MVLNVQRRDRPLKRGVVPSMVPQILPVGRDREMVGDVVVHPSFYFSVVLVGERLVPWCAGGGGVGVGTGCRAYSGG